MRLDENQKAEIKRAINLLHPNSELFEIRLIGGKGTASGYFKSAEAAVKALESFQPSRYMGKFNTYIVLNQINEACYSRSQRDAIIEKPDKTTEDKDIERYKWLMIDLDPERTKGVSSSEAELQAAFAKAKAIKSYLASEGWKEPVSAVSGNGAHLLYRFDAVNTPENKSRFEKALKALHTRFSDEAVAVDVTTFNPARITKLYGTYARKGADSPERPHRLSRILESTPEIIEVNDISLIDRLIKENLPDEQECKATAPKASVSTVSGRKFSAAEFIEKHGIAVKCTESYKGGTKYVLQHCLFDESHKGKDAAIFESADGTLGYKCQHNSCSDKHWKDVRLLFEPQAYDIKERKPKQKQEKTSSEYEADGTGELTIANLTEYLRAKSITVRYNIITHQVEYSGFTGESQDHLKEIAPALIYDELHFELDKCTIDKIGQFMNVIATRNKYNPVLEAIRSVKWDGTDRIDEIYRIFGIPQQDRLSRTIIHKWLMQCYCGLHNSMDNPFSLDIVLVFQGAQGIGKTRFLEKLTLNSRYFGEGRTYDPRNKDSQIECTSKWICELGEIGSTMKKDIDSLKAFLTSSTDEYRMPYGKAALRYARMTSFCGTTNDTQFLVDTTGNRRFATISIPEGIVIDYDRDVKNFDSLQLWKQVAEEVEALIAVNNSSYAACFRLTRDELAELNSRNTEHLKPLKGELEVIDVLEQQSRTDSGYTVEKRYMTVTEFIENNTSLKKYNTQQISKVLDKLGYPTVQKRIEGRAYPSKVRLLPYRRYVNSNQVYY